MSAAPALDDLFAQLDGMRHALHAGELEDVERLLNRHDHDVRAFLHADGGRTAGYDALAVLLRAQPLQHRPIELRREAGSNAEVAGAGGRVRSAVEPESGIRALAQGGPGVGRVDPPTEGRRVYPRTHTLTL